MVEDLVKTVEISEKYIKKNIILIDAIEEAIYYLNDSSKEKRFENILCIKNSIENNCASKIRYDVSILPESDIATIKEEAEEEKLLNFETFVPEELSDILIQTHHQTGHKKGFFESPKARIAIYLKTNILNNSYLILSTVNNI